MPDEQTTKMKVDLSEMKKEFREAQRQIQLVNSEFKAATAGMSRWTDSADGLSAKINQLNGVLDAETKKLSSLEKQHALVVKEQGEQSKGAQELLIKINNQKASIEKTRSSLTYYTNKLSDMKEASEHVATASEKLSSTIDEQQKSLNELKGKYANLVLEQGKSSREAQDCAEEIQKLSQKLNQNKQALSNASRAADDLDSSLDDVEDSADGAGDGFTVMKGALSDLIADGIREGISALKEFVTAADEAHHNFQAQTGASAAEMQQFSKEMDDLYAKNYGESLQDIGDKMAYIKQVTGETDPSNIRELTENAIALEATFGSDFQETIRGVQNLMTHFGLDAEEAFDLFAKGSQEGLDYTDELGDNIAEYGGNFKQAGYSAEEYFQLLKNGTKGGAYNLDKVNDSINEIKNRLGDGTIKDAIKDFSKGTQNTFKAWEKGDATMKDVIASIVKDISSCKDEQEALTMAATAFGTMGEDANLNVIKSLNTLGDDFTNVKGKMEEVKNVRYDSISSNLETIKRGLLNNIVQPIAGPVLSGLVSLGNWFMSNTPIILTAVTSIGAAFLTWNISTIIAQVTTGITAMIAAVKALGVAIAANPIGLIATVAAAAAVGIITYVEASKKARKENDENIKSTKALIEQQEALTDALKQTKQARKDATASAEQESGQADIYRSRLEKLIGVEEKSAAQKALIKDYVEKLNAVMPDLNLKYDEEKDKLNQSTQAIKDNIAAQKDLLLAKAAQNNLESIAGDIAKTEMQQADLAKQRTENELAYNEAKEASTKAMQEWLDSGAREYGAQFDAMRKASEAEKNKKEAYDQSTKALEENKQKLKELNAEYNNTEKYAKEKLNTGEIESQLAQITEKMRQKGKEVPKAIADGIRSEKYAIPTSVKGMENLIKFDDLAQDAKLTGVKIPSNLAAGISSGKTSAEAAIKALNNVAKFDNSEAVKNATAAGTKIPEALRKGIASGKISVEEASKRLENVVKLDGAVQKAGINGKKIPEALSNGIISGKVSLDDAQKRLNEAVKFQGLATKSGAMGKKAVASLVQGILSGTTTAEEAGKKLAEASTKGQKNGSKNSKSTGEKSGKDYADGVKSKKSDAEKSGKTVGAASTKGAKDGAKDAKKKGQDTGKDYAKGVDSQKGTAKKSGQNVGKNATSGAKSGSDGMKKTGAGAGGSFAEGVGSKSGTAKTKGSAVAKSANDGLKSYNSSAETSGENFGQGFINGIGSFVDSAWQKAKNLAKSAWNGLKEGQKEGSPSKLTTQSGKFFGQGYQNGIAATAKAVVHEATGLAVEAYNALRKAQEEGSPSKLTYRSGVNFTKGYINGIASMEKSLVKTVQALTGKAITTAMNLKSFDFSSAASNASAAFSSVISEKITYMSNKITYQNEQKIAQLDKQLNTYQSALDKIESQYGSVKTTYDKAKKGYDTAKKNYDKAQKKYQDAKTAKQKANYKSQMADYKKQMTAYKKQMAADNSQAAQAKKKQATYKKLVAEQTKFKEAYQDASAQMLSELNNALSEYQTKAQALIDDTINGISNKYQAKYDALTEKQNSLIEKLKSAGDLFEVSGAGIMTVNDLTEQTKNIKEYAAKLQKIKGKVSADLFDQIASYDMDQGNAFMDRLLSLSDADLKAYSDAYDTKMKTAESLAKQTYASDFKDIASSYKKALLKAYKDLPKQLEALGVQSMKGFANGLTKNTDYLSKSVKTLIKGMVDTFKKDLKIHSPSKVTEQLGIFSGLGFGGGLLDSVKQVQKNAKKFISSVTEPLDQVKAGIGNVRTAVNRGNGSTAPTSQTVINNYNLVQNNSSPKSLSALETYRARRQQVAMVKAMTQPV